MTKIDSTGLLVAKKTAGQAAAHFVQEGMLVGLGTGSTTAFFIEALALRCHEGLSIKAVATSENSSRLAQKAGIPLIDPNSIQTIDLTIDGADEIDDHKNMIKGGGGALLREKLLALASREMIVIVDETKLVDHLGGCPLPVEVVRFAYHTTLKRLEKEGYMGTLRLKHHNELFISDNGNYIFDIHLNHPISDPAEEHRKLKLVEGVVETGLFVQVAGRVVVGYEDGNVKVLR